MSNLTRKLDRAKSSEYKSKRKKLDQWVAANEAKLITYLQCHPSTKDLPLDQLKNLVSSPEAKSRLMANLPENWDDMLDQPFPEVTPDPK